MELDKDNIKITSGRDEGSARITVKAINEEDLAVKKKTIPLVARKNKPLVAKDITVEALLEYIKNSIDNLPKIMEESFRRLLTLDRKTTVDCISATSIRELVKRVNEYNAYYSETPILKEDIVSILQGGEGYILLYYK